MSYTLKVADRSGHAVALTVDEATMSQPAVAVIFDVFAQKPDKLIAAGIINENDSFNLRQLQNIVFDEDAQGTFIREDVSFTADGALVDPEQPLKNVCDRFTKNCSLLVESSQVVQSGNPAAEFSRMLTIYMLGIGKELDVTKEHLDLQETLTALEHGGLIEIDVKRASYALSQRGKQIHSQTLLEATELENRFDIFGDVDVDEKGIAHFDTGLGVDLRIPMFELKAIDPFKARVLLGMAAGEFDELPDWAEQISSTAFYDTLFAPVESAPSVEDLGRTQLQTIAEQANRKLRELSE